MTRCYIHIPVPEEVSVRVAYMENRWQPRKSRSAPHITLLYPREVKSDFKEADIIRPLSKLSQDMERFPVVVSGVFSLGGGRSTICAAVLPSEGMGRCASWAESLINHMLEPIDQGNADVRRHMIIASGIRLEDCEKAWEDVRDPLDPPWEYQWMCREVVVLFQDNRSGVWRIGATFSLLAPE